MEYRVFSFWFSVAVWIVGFIVLWKIEPPRLERIDRKARPRAGIGQRETLSGENLIAEARDLVMSRLSVIIPARNEEARLPELLRSLAAQETRPLEVIVVDDASTDRTADIVHGSLARLIPAADKPEEWQGKSWACWNGARSASGDCFLFLDADTSLAPDALVRLAAEKIRSGGVLSVQPYHRVKRVYEQLSAFFNLIVMAGLGTFTVLGSRIPPSGAFGPCLLSGRQEYFRSGGHRTVRLDVVEDVAIGKLFVSGGTPLSLFGGRGTLSFRMYPEGFRSLVEGWIKAMAIGAGSVRPVILTVIVLWIIGATGAAAALGVFIVSAGRDLSYAPILYAAYVLQLLRLFRTVGSFSPLTALFYPLPLLFFHGVFFASLFSVALLGRVSWKGRVIRTRGIHRRSGTDPDTSADPGSGAHPGPGTPGNKDAGGNAE